MSVDLNNYDIKILSKIINDGLKKSHLKLQSKFPKAEFHKDSTKITSENKAKLQKKLNNLLNDFESLEGDSNISKISPSGIYDADISESAEFSCTQTSDINLHNFSEGYLADKSQSSSKVLHTINEDFKDYPIKRNANRDETVINNETSSGIHSDLSYHNDYQDDSDVHSNCSSTQYVIPMYGGDSSDTDSCESEHKENIRPRTHEHYKGNAKFYRIAYDTKSEDDSLSEEQNESSIINESNQIDNDSSASCNNWKRSFSWLKTSVHSCTCCHCNSSESCDRSRCNNMYLDPYYRSFNPQSSLRANCQSTPRRSSKNDSCYSQSSCSCESCIKIRTRELSHMFIS